MCSAWGDGQVKCTVANPLAIRDGFGDVHDRMVQEWGYSVMAGVVGQYVAGGVTNVF